MIKLHIDRINFESLTEIAQDQDELAWWLGNNSLVTYYSDNNVAASVEETLAAVQLALAQGVDHITIIETQKAYHFNGCDPVEVCHMYAGTPEKLGRDLVRAFKK